MIFQSFILGLSLVISIAFSSLAQVKPAYQLFKNNGDPATYTELLSAASQAEVVMFGELHNNPIAHWLRLELARDLYPLINKNLVIGAEMFEADNQLLIDEYMHGHILERHFTAEAKLWNNYSTDYRPLFEFAREHKLNFIATNIPRRYAALVHREGFEALDSLSEAARRYIAPLPIPYDPDLPGYQAMLNMGGMPAHASENLPKAQAIKDATMAHFILQNLPEDGIFLHLHGTYHSDNDEGINWYLRNYADVPPVLLTISTTEQENVEELEEAHLEKADFILVVPSRMTKTY